MKFQCDYAADPTLPHSWRYEFDKAGPGALLDIGTHAVDMMRDLFGGISEVVGQPQRYQSQNDTYLPQQLLATAMLNCLKKLR